MYPWRCYFNSTYNNRLNIFEVVYLISKYLVQGPLHPWTCEYQYVIFMKEVYVYLSIVFRVPCTHELVSF